MVPPRAALEWGIGSRSPFRTHGFGTHALGSQTPPPHVQAALPWSLFLKSLPQGPGPTKVLRDD